MSVREHWRALSCSGACGRRVYSRPCTFRVLGASSELFRGWLSSLVCVLSPPRYDLSVDRRRPYRVIDYLLKDRYGEPERGEWMGADKNSSRRRWKLQQDAHGFQHTSPTHYPNWPSPRSHWSATGPRNQHTTFRPENAAEHQTSSLQTNTGQTGEHHRSDRSLLVRVGNFH
jgi:hypothetical protein